MRSLSVPLSLSVPRSLSVPLCVLLLPLAACKKEPEPPVLAPPFAVTAPHSGVGHEPRKPGFKQDKVPPELNPAKNVRGQTPVLPRAGLAALRPFVAGRTTKIGQGSMTLTLGDGPAATLPVTVYRRDPVVILSADRPDLGVVLSFPSLVPGSHVRGTYVRGEGQPAQPQPNLRVRVGGAGAPDPLQAADQATGTTLTVRVVAGATPGAAAGTFDGQVSRDAGEVVRKVTGGTFQVQLDLSLAAAREALAGIHLPSQPMLRNVASPAGPETAPAPPVK